MERKLGTATVLKREDMHSVQQENLKTSMFLSPLINE